MVLERHSQQGTRCVEYSKSVGVKESASMLRRRSAACSISLCAECEFTQGKDADERVDRGGVAFLEVTASALNATRFGPNGIGSVFRR